jgi:hypothetical protein
VEERERERERESWMRQRDRDERESLMRERDQKEKEEYEVERERSERKRRKRNSGSLDELFVETKLENMTIESIYEPFTLLELERLYVLWWRVDGGFSQSSFRLQFLEKCVRIIFLISPPPDIALQKEIPSLSHVYANFSGERKFQWEVQLPEGKQLKMTEGDVERIDTPHFIGFWAELETKKVLIER